MYRKISFVVGSLAVMHFFFDGPNMFRSITGLKSTVLLAKEGSKSCPTLLLENGLAINFFLPVGEITVGIAACPRIGLLGWKSFRFFAGLGNDGSADGLSAEVKWMCGL